MNEIDGKTLNDDDDDDHQNEPYRHTRDPAQRIQSY
jgi:hypothetical protein